MAPDTNSTTVHPADLENRNLSGMEALPTPAALKRAQPVGAAAAKTVLQARAEIRAQLHGKAPRRALVITGPCSLHDPQAALEYARKLAPLARAHSNELLIIMRAYFAKPRTTVGWKGLINDPHLDGSCDVAAGISEARRLLLGISELGLPCATEFLDPISPQYLADGVAWAAIGARTTESQPHREMASGLSMPVGFKNGTDGHLSGALDAVLAAAHPHTFLGVHESGGASVVKTAGNPDTHIVLRGGRSGENYAAQHVAAAAQQLTQRGGPARGVLVDCSHGNSRKNHARQSAALQSCAAQFRAGAPGLLGVMLESHLHAGAQTWQPGAPLQYGVSITDACIGFEETEQLLACLAAALR